MKTGRRRTGLRWAARFTLACAAVGLFGAAAAAQAPITDNDYVVEVVQGPVLGSGRIIGLGGAYTAIAEGIDGSPWNPAAYGSRSLWELDFFEWEITAGILFPGAFSGDDFFNTGNDDGAVFDQFVFLAFGFRLQFGEVGFGTLPRLSLYQIRDPANPDRPLSVTLIVGNYGFGHQFFDGQLVVGFGARTASLTVMSDLETLVSMTSSGPEVGAILRLADQRWRAGVAFRSAVRDDNSSLRRGAPDAMGIYRAGGFVLPSEITMPWEVQLGFALQIGRRPLNREFVDPEEAERDLEAALTLRRWEREQAQVARELEASGEAPPAPDPYRWLPRRASDPAFARAEAGLQPEEDEALEREIEATEDAREREVKELTRRFLLISAEVLITGPTRAGVGMEGVGVEGFLQQRHVPGGAETTYGLRLGIEGEPWAGRLKLRGGGYLEPSRVAGVGYRLHGTAGFDLRLLTWDLFGLMDDFDVRAGLTMDVAERYFDWGIGVGFWH